MKVSLSLCMHLCVSMSPSSFRGIDVFELQLHVLFKRFLKLCLIFPSLRSAFTCTAPSFTCVCVCFHFYPVLSEFLVVVAPIYENKLLRHSFGFYFRKQEAQLWKTQGRKAALTCVWSLRRTHTSPGSPLSLSEACRCRLKRGRGTVGRLSGRNMLAGAGVMMAFVTGPKHTNRK